MTSKMKPIPEDRPLSAQEATLVRWLLDHGTRSAKAYLSQVDSVRVISRCGCGCASIDFVTEPKGMEVLSDYQWEDQTGLFAVFIFARGGVLAGLDVYSVDGR